MIVVMSGSVIFTLLQRLSFNGVTEGAMTL